MVVVLLHIAEPVQATLAAQVLTSPQALPGCPPPRPGLLVLGSPSHRHHTRPLQLIKACSPTVMKDSCREGRNGSLLGLVLAKSP